MLPYSLADIISNFMEDSDIKNKYKKILKLVTLFIKIINLLV